MNTQELEYFKKLVEDRADSVRVFKKPSMRNGFRGVVDKYSDIAHFIYELLQNADDTRATKARFVLSREKLIFVHNGPRSFSVSDPASEEEDRASGHLGDLNAITSIGQSSKGGFQAENAPKIGKFGVGFKAVFSYTKTPSIYSPTFNFRLADYIVPSLLTNNHPLSNTGETLFDLPFDNPECPADKAFAEIKDKLQSLVSPLLFLNSLKEIVYTVQDQGDLMGIYTKETIEEHMFGDIKANLIQLKHENLDNDTVVEKLWLFSREAADLKNPPYSVGFYLDENNKLLPREPRAFCFFTTKEPTGLKFLIHAPFLLTDSREGIKAREKHNERMIELLAQLAADALVCLRDIGLRNGEKLIDDNILDVIPYVPSTRSPNEISFRPFYDKILNAFKTEKLLPTRDGYTNCSHAYWSDVADYLRVFDDEQLVVITGRNDAKWVFRGRGRDKTRTKAPALAEYVDELVRDFYTDEDLLRTVSEELVESQPMEWLLKLYSFISHTSGRINLVRKHNLPIFLDQTPKAAKIFQDDLKERHLFLPDDENETDSDEEYGIDYKVIHPELYGHEETQDLAKKLEICRPSPKDEIFSKIVPFYEKKGDEGIDTLPHFKKIFRYYLECNVIEQWELVEKLTTVAFVLCTKNGGAPDKQFRGEASTMYFPTDSLQTYFAGNDTIYFVFTDEYLKLFPDNEKELMKFLRELGVEEHPRKMSLEQTWNDAKSSGYPMNGRPQESWQIHFIEGLKEAVNKMQKRPTFELSVILWNEVCAAITRDCFNQYQKIDAVYCGEHKYFYYQLRSEKFPSPALSVLNTIPWLRKSSGQFVPVSKMFLDELAVEYNQNLQGAFKLLDYLEFAKRPVEKVSTLDSLSDADKETFEWGKLVKENGINSKEDIAEFLKFKQRREKSTAKSGTNGYQEARDDNEGTWSYPEENEDNTQPRENILRRIGRSIKERRVSRQSGENHRPILPDSPKDDDDYTHPSEDIRKAIEKAQDKASREIEALEDKQELLDQVEKYERYSFGWFKALLELEKFEDQDGKSQSSELSISFFQVCREEGTSRTLILRQPNKTISQNIEDLKDIPLELHFSNSAAPNRKLPIEVVSVKPYTLRVKLKDSSGLTGIPWKQIAEATICVKNPQFLLQKLYDHFKSLDFDDSYDLKQNLPANLNFVFGPPGTGKTTCISRKIRKLMEAAEHSPLRILVLAPTNKAADVIAKRILSQDDKHSCESWLIRFGGTQDTELEHSSIFKDHSFDYGAVERCAVITTIARYPYDYFQNGGDGHFPIARVAWDYVVIDEASMIPLVTILNVLYHATPKCFILAGDPFQIEPITRLKEWKNENIYSMVELQNFANPTTVPREYPVERLTTQYRSIPSIGTIFSQLTYDGVLQHNRSEEDRRQLGIRGRALRPINLIYFPVSKFESIYRAKHLNNKSSYQIYTVLFAFEFLRYLISDLQFIEKDGPVSIGIIAPYAAQANLIARLVQTLPKSTRHLVNVGTIHGFQGDECDIIIGVFNPPPVISTSSELFLNKKNIINVCISRARDCMFLLMPDDKTVGREHLTVLKQLEHLCRQNVDVQKAISADWEQQIFGNANFLEQNSFATGHLPVNVYNSNAEHRYEIRCEDGAVDVQLIAKHQ